MAQKLAYGTCLLFALCAASERPEIPAESVGPIRIGDHSQVAVQFEDHALEAAHVRALRETILGITQRDVNRDFSQGLASQIFSNAYTFVVEGTLDGLAYVADALGIQAAPLDAFFDRMDSKCNAYVLNALVLNASSSSSDAPWHDFAVQIHFDTTLSQFFHNRFPENEELRFLPERFPNDGAARTVSVLYLNDVTTGGEIQVFDWVPSQFRSDPLLDTCQKRAAKNCRKKKKRRKRSCEIAEVDAELERRTLGSVKPRAGRLVQFDGRYAHAVRMLTSINETTTNAGKSSLDSDKGGHSGLRISLVLEQFVYPPNLVEKTPTCWVTYNKKPFYARDDLRDRFAGECLPNSECQPKAFGSSSVNGDLFQQCMDNGRAKSNGEARLHSMDEKATVAPSSGVPLYRACLQQASMVQKKRRRRKQKRMHKSGDL